MLTEEQKQEEQTRKRYLDSFFDFTKDCLGYRDLGEIHRPICEKLGEIRFIDNNKPIRNLWLWARGHFKTSIITYAHTIWLIINNPDIWILVASNIVTNAEFIIKDIKSHFMKNPEFRKYSAGSPQQSSRNR